MSRKTQLLKAAAGIGAAALLATAVIGVAHTPWGRPLLRLPLLSGLASRAGCPVGDIEPAAFEKVRQTKLQGEVGTTAAKAHPALDFTLGKTKRSAVEQWAKTKQARCKAGLVASVLQCDDVPVAGGAPISQLRLQFDAAERLVSVDLFRASKDDQALVQRFHELGQELDASVGPATSSAGSPTLALMKQRPLQTVVRTYRYRDYVASAMLLNLGKRGLRLREQYRWLPPVAPA
jgi:hypothetical protein